MTYHVYTLKSGDVLFVPADAAVQRYTPTVSTDDVVEMDVDPAFVGLLASGGTSARTPKVKRRKQRHPRTPKKWWKRRKLVMELGTSAAAKKLGLRTEVLSSMAGYYGWRYPKFKRAPKTEVSNA